MWVLLPGGPGKPDAQVNITTTEVLEKTPSNLPGSQTLLLAHVVDQITKGQIRHRQIVSAASGIGKFNPVFPISYLRVGSVITKLISHATRSA